MTNEQLRAEYEKLMTAARYWSDKCDALEQKYPGVRPGWVSADLAIDRSYASKALADANAIKAKMDA